MTYIKGVPVLALDIVRLEEPVDVEARPGLPTQFVLSSLVSQVIVLPPALAMTSRVTDSYPDISWVNRVAALVTEPVRASSSGSTTATAAAGVCVLPSGPVTVTSLPEPAAIDTGKGVVEVTLEIVTL